MSSPSASSRSPHSSVSSALAAAATPSVWYAESTPAIPNGRQRASGATCDLGCRQSPHKGVLSLRPSCGPSLPEPAVRLAHLPPGLGLVLRSEVGAAHGLDNMGCQTLAPQSGRELGKRSGRLGLRHGFLPGGHGPRLVGVR